MPGGAVYVPNPALFLHIRRKKKKTTTKGWKKSALGGSAPKFPRLHVQNRLLVGHTLRPSFG